jgi:osmotically-inducible protein OsmY
MAEITAPAPRADVDILEAIDDLICDYPPLVLDRHHFHIAVEHGKVTVSGHTRTTITRRALIERLAEVAGVVTVNADAFYSDTDLRLQVSHLLPIGVLANVSYGVVILTGLLPIGATETALVAAIEDMAGVRAVRAQFSH